MAIAQPVPADLRVEERFAELVTAQGVIKVALTADELAKESPQGGLSGLRPGVPPHLVVEVCQGATCASCTTYVAADC